jgi:hypothetical protein
VTDDERPRFNVFEAGALAALGAFREQLIEARLHIENEPEPALDVVLELLDDTIRMIRTRGRNEPPTELAVYS